MSEWVFTVKGRNAEFGELTVDFECTSLSVTKRNQTVNLVRQIMVHTKM